MRKHQRTRQRNIPAAVLALLLILGAQSAQGQDRKSAESVGWVGTGSCSALSCHGGRREPLGLKGSEYTFSEAYDPHNQAFSVLYGERSKTIEKNLKQLKSIEEARPTENDTCLRCHVYQGYSSEAKWTRSPEFALADGVSCEGCHGPASPWLVVHTEAGFKGLTEQQKYEEFGLRPTKDLLARGQSCVECHVGTGSTDVNHDLIAAGHPRLDFDYSSQMGKYPKHWKLADDKARNPDYEAKVFVLGQLLTAKASLDLLEARAVRSIPEASTSPWPEFAEYSCFSCHHELTKKGWASANVTLSSKRGQLQWGTWALPLADVLPPTLVGLDARSSLSDLGSLRLLMSQPDPDASTVAARARQASAELERMARLINAGRITPDEVRGMLGRSLEFDRPGSPLDWDSAARRYLAIVALDKAAADFDPRYSDRPVVEGLERLFRQLNLPMRVDRRGGIFDSPYRFDPDRVQIEFRSVQAALPNP